VSGPGPKPPGKTVMTTSISLGRHPLMHVDVRHVPALQSIVWLRRGWEDLRHLGLLSLAHGTMIAVLGAVLLMLFSTNVYLVVAAISGYLLVGPAMTTGLCELSRRRAARESLSVDDSLQPVSRNTNSLLQFGAILAVITVIWFAASAIMLQTILHTSAPSLAVVLWGSFTDGVSRPQL